MYSTVPRRARCLVPLSAGTVMVMHSTAPPRHPDELVIPVVAMGHPVPPSMLPTSTPAGALYDKATP